MGASAVQGAGEALGALGPALCAASAADAHHGTGGWNGFYGPGERAGPCSELPTGLGSSDVATLTKALAHEPARTVSD